MIRAIPGWANFLALWAAYFIISILLAVITGWDADLKFIGFITAIYCGGYLAKWRFHDGGWHFK